MVALSTRMAPLELIVLDMAQTAAATSLHAADRIELMVAMTTLASCLKEVAKPSQWGVENLRPLAWNIAILPQTHPTAQYTPVPAPQPRLTFATALISNAIRPLQDMGLRMSFAFRHA